MGGERDRVGGGKGGGKRQRDIFPEKKGTAAPWEEEEEEEESVSGKHGSINSRGRGRHHLPKTILYNGSCVYDSVRSLADLWTVFLSGQWTFTFWFNSIFSAITNTRIPVLNGKSADASAERKNE